MRFRRPRCGRHRRMSAGGSRSMVTTSLLIARGAHYEAIRDDGLRIESPDDVITLRIPVVDGPSGFPGPAMTSCCWQRRHKTRKPRSTPSRRWRRRRFRSSALRTASRTSAWRRPIRQCVRRVRLVSGRLPDARQRQAVVRAEERDSARRLLSVRARTAGRRGGGCLSRRRRSMPRRSQTSCDGNIASCCRISAMPSTRCAVRRRGAAALAQRARREGARVPGSGGHLVHRPTTKRMPRVSSAKCIRERSDGAERRGGSSWQSLERRLGTIETDYLNGEIVRLGQQSRGADPGQCASAVSVAAGRARAQAAWQRESRQDSDRARSSTESTAVARAGRPQWDRSASRAASARRTPGSQSPTGRRESSSVRRARRTRD